MFTIQYLINVIIKFIIFVNRKEKHEKYLF